MRRNYDGDYLSRIAKPPVYGPGVYIWAHPAQMKYRRDAERNKDRLRTARVLERELSAQQIARLNGKS